MKKYFKVSTTAIIIVLFLACREQKAVNSEGNYRPELEKRLLVNTPIGKPDTVTVLNAPVRITRKIRRNTNGNLLIAAFTKVIIYDGESFSPIPKPKNFESYAAFDAMQDSNGNIWIASTEHGIFCYDGQKVKHLSINDGLASNRVMDILEDSNGNIWFATMDGASCYTGKGFLNFAAKEGLINPDVNAIMEDRTGKIWFGTRGGVYIYNPLPASFSEIMNTEGDPIKNVRSIIEDRDGTIWLGGEEGVLSYDNGGVRLLSTKKGISIYEDDNANIWFTHQTNTTHKSGLSFFSRESLSINTPEVTEVFTDEGMLFGISEDKNGDIWVGCLNGVLVYDKKSIKYYGDTE